MSKIRWGLLACGAIAKAFANGLKNAETGSLYAVASRSEDKAKAFAAEYGAEKFYGSYEALLADPKVDAVYISTPHPMHTEWAIKAAEAGKHILVEKPIAINQYEAMSIIQAAAENNVFLMEAYMYRCNPQTLKLRELLRAKPVGDIAVIKASFSFGGGLGSSGRIWANALGGGGILDVGGYTTSYARLIAGEALGRPFADPAKVSGSAFLNPQTGVDAWAAGILEFEGGIIAQVSTGVGVTQNNVVEIFGTQGKITVANPYVCSRGAAQDGEIELFKRGAEPETIRIPAPVNSYTYEADVCGRAIRAGLREAVEMTLADTMGNIRVQDSWRQAAGLIYDSEKIEDMPAVTYANRKLEHRNPIMKPGRIEYLDKDVSRLIMGVDNQVTSPHVQAVFDHYFENGGNALDTAFIYGEVKSRLVGKWMNSRGVRKDMVIIAKGAHTPNCNPAALTSQLVKQLEWFGTDYADIYLMHRDNPEIPVGEFIDVLNEHVKAGRIRTFGGSNWSLERIEQANAYAKNKGLQPMSICSNNLSLAVMVKPVWDGCIHVHDNKSLTWLEKNQMALLPWSSQARGFFVPAIAHPEKRGDASLVNSWYSGDNFERQRRAIELAEMYGVEPINISLAWVLGQKFPVFALIGPRTLAETRSSMRSLEINLTPEEMAYLDLK